MQVAKFHCAGCRLPGHLIAKAEAIYWDLSNKIRRLRDCGVLSRGIISINYDECTIHIQKDIPFANRSQPDASAAFQEGSEELAEEIMFDLSEVIKVFRKAMVVEGHTGGT